MACGLGTAVADAAACEPRGIPLWSGVSKSRRYLRQDLGSYSGLSELKRVRQSLVPDYPQPKVVCVGYLNKKRPQGRFLFLDF